MSTGKKLAGPSKLSKDLAKKEKKAEAKALVPNSVITKGPRRPVGGGQGKPDVLTMLRNELLAGNAAVYRYLAMLSEPGMSGRPPLDMGDWLLDTGVYEFPLDFTLTAGAAGVVYCGLVADGWLNDSQAQFAVTPGATAWCSGTNATQTPATGTAAGANDVRLTISAPSDLTLSQYMSWRMVANILEVWPESVETATSGSIQMFSAASPTALETSALNGATYASIANASQSYINHTAYPLGGWESGDTARVHITPSSSDCLKFKQLALTASAATVPTFGAGFIASGLTAGQVVHVRVWTKFEVSKGTGRSIDPTPTSFERPSMANVAQPMAALSVVPHAKGPAAYHAARPILAMEAVKPGSATSLGAALSNGVKDALPSLLASGLKAATNFLPTIVGKGISALGSLIFG